MSSFFLSESWIFLYAGSDTSAFSCSETATISVFVLSMVFKLNSMEWLVSFLLHSNRIPCHSPRKSSSLLPIDGSTYALNPLGITLFSKHFFKNTTCDSYLPHLSFSLSSLKANLSFSFSIRSAPITVCADLRSRLSIVMLGNEICEPLPEVRPSLSSVPDKFAPSSDGVGVRADVGQSVSPFCSNSVRLRLFITENMLGMVELL